MLRLRQPQLAGRSAALVSQLWLQPRQPQLLPQTVLLQLRPYAAKGLRVQLESPGQVMNKFIPVPKEVRSSIFTKLGWQQRYENLFARLRSTQSVAELKRRLPGFSYADFALEAQTIFKRMNTALADGNKKALVEVVTPQILQGLSVEIDKRSPASKIWRLQEYTKRASVETVQIIQTGDPSMEFAQLTVRLNYLQTLSSQKGKEEKSRQTTDFIVFEMNTVKKTPWKICGKLLPSWIDKLNEKEA